MALREVLVRFARRFTDVFVCFPDDSPQELYNLAWPTGSLSGRPCG